ncbi:MAG: hypothetical protein HFJ50_06440 [Clostridia bacterium]|jgi:hypothetical protein|nr:hypothetical protein [Clostridia bacterium]
MQNKEIEEDKKHLRNLSEDALKCEDDELIGIDAYAVGSITRILQYIDQLENKVKELEKENTDIKEVYIRTAKHLDKKGMLELSEYLLAQIEATPTFTTWEEYTTWVNKQVIRDKIKRIENETWYIGDGYSAKEACIDELQELLEEK